MSLYLDYNATTPLHPQALAVMLPYFGRDFANPSSGHGSGRIAAKAVDDARRSMALNLGVHPTEILFTPGGSAANNLALKGTADRVRTGHFITTAVEHPSVRDVISHLESRGFDVTVLPVDGHGVVDPDGVRKALREDTRLVSVMYANNETGTISPIAEIGQVLAGTGVLFHTDAVQAVGKYPVEFMDTGVHMAALSAHKFGGPKGIGALVVRKGVELDPLVHGGGQEHGLLAGTTNTPSIVAMAKALHLRFEGLATAFEAMTTLRDSLETRLRESFPDLVRNGHPVQRLPNTLSVTFPGLDGAALIEALDRKGLHVSGGAACHAVGGRSSVLAAMGAPVGATLRFSLAPETTAAEIDQAVEITIEAVNQDCS